MKAPGGPRVPTLRPVRSAAGGEEIVLKTSEKGLALHSIDRHLGSGLITAALLLLGAGGWAVTTELSGAVLAPGTMVVDGNVKMVQHPVGGMVKEIAVRNGMVVRQGDVVVRLDDDVARADLAMVDNALDALVIRQSRLEAERDGSPVLTPAPSLASRLDEPALAELIGSETRYFELAHPGPRRAEGAAPRAHRAAAGADRPTPPPGNRPRRIRLPWSGTSSTVSRNCSRRRSSRGLVSSNSSARSRGCWARSDNSARRSPHRKVASRRPRAADHPGRSGTAQ